MEMVKRKSWTVNRKDGQQQVHLPRRDRKGKEEAVPVPPTAALHVAGELYRQTLCSYYMMIFLATFWVILTVFSCAHPCVFVLHEHDQSFKYDSIISNHPPQRKTVRVLLLGRNMPMPRITSIRWMRYIKG